MNNRWAQKKLFNLQLLGIKLCTNFVYQTNNNQWLAAC